MYVQIIIKLLETDKKEKKKAKATRWILCNIHIEKGFKHW